MLQEHQEAKRCLPYVWAAIKDITSIEVLVASNSIRSFVTGTVIFACCFSLVLSQLLKVVQQTTETGTVNKNGLVNAITGRLICAMLKRVLSYLRNTPLNLRIKAYYAAHIFRAYSRLDLPTFDDPLIQSQLEGAANDRSSVAWESVQNFIVLCSTVVQLVTQMSVLISVLQEQRDGVLLALISFAQPLFQWLRGMRFIFPGAWAATCRNEQYIKMQGLKRIVTERSHRQELVAGSLFSYLYSEFLTAQSKLGYDVSTFQETLQRSKTQDRLLSLSSLIDIVAETPQEEVILLLTALQNPSSTPASLASLNMIQSAVSSFSQSTFEILRQFDSISDRLDSLRKLYGLSEIPNGIEDGTVAFPENHQKLLKGLSVEFRNVSFRYPGTDQFALRYVSFKIERVIVGANGSGKSTVLKLIARIYDPNEGKILLNSYDIRSLKLVDLRCAIAVLFQDYTYFALSIKENIGLGDPQIARNDEKIVEAAKLGGAFDIINRLPEGFDTYLVRPIQDFYSSLPQDTKMLFGRPVDYAIVRKAGGLGETTNTQLSGGQLQRLMVSRTFMKTLNDDTGVGLLLFDEPSASLDPEAEHDLFQRLRTIKGQKTMIFSTHRFGNLTRHADVILYMRESEVEEMGTHSDLMALGKGYAHIYSLQAEAFRN